MITISKREKLASNLEVKLGDQLSKRAKYWQSHIEAQRKLPGPAAAYCRKHNLHLVSFYVWRKRLGEEAVGAPAKQFIEATVEKNRDEPPISAQIPDPKWTAEFLIHLMRGIS